MREEIHGKFTLAEAPAVVSGVRFVFLGEDHCVLYFSLAMSFVFSVALAPPKDLEGKRISWPREENKVALIKRGWLSRYFQSN